MDLFASLMGHGRSGIWMVTGGGSIRTHGNSSQVANILKSVRAKTLCSYVLMKTRRGYFENPRVVSLALW